MKLYKVAAVATTAVACMLVAGCAQDTPKSVFQNSDEYGNRVFVPSVLSGSVQKMVADNKPMPFSTITFSRSAKINYEGTVVPISADVTYENAGNGLVREMERAYRNGVVTGQSFSLTHRGLLQLYDQTFQPTYQRMPYALHVSAISRFDSSFDQPTLNYSYEMSSDAPRYRTNSRSGSCTLGKTYAASKFATGISGDAKEFECKFYNDNGVLDGDFSYVYLDTYGVAVLKDVAKTNAEIHWTISNFKAK